MKKFLLIVALATFSFASAQKGTILVGGSVGYTSEKESFRGFESKTSSVDFSPKVGYQFHDSWTAGIETSFGSTKRPEERFDGSTVDVKTNTTKVGAFLRYTVPFSESFAFFTELGAGYKARKVEDAKQNGMYVGITPALFINMSKGFGLNFNIGGLGYSTLNYKDNGPKTNSFDFNLGKAFNVGISKNF
ncbi:hypothetical protein B4N84_24930 [Flavobacterium sp. IR1]|nr:hypothetical protein B4N84_24930 [Flavobacterium sp. IR1]